MKKETSGSAKVGLGHYRIESKLGEGGMGVVYKARDTRLDRAVAIKVLPQEAVADADRKNRFVREAKAASALNHPGIITIYDIGNVDGVDFIAMEYVAGSTLADLLRSRSLRLSEALKYAVQIADALSAAHEAGIVHRDLKPANVMVTEKGAIKVLDFGLAKLLEPGESEEVEATGTALPQLRTEEGLVVGTAAYMSPEQAEGRKLDSRSDIFSFGAVLYEMVAGTRPFQGATRMSVLSAVLREEPLSLSETAPQTPRDLEKIVARCLRKDADRRFQHISDVKVALEEVGEELRQQPATASGRVPAARRPRRGRSLAAAAGVLGLIAATAVATWWLLRPNASPRVAVLKQLTFDSGLTTDPVLSPDGKIMAFASDRSGEGNLDIWIQQLATGEARRLTQDSSDESEPAFTPDGSRVAFRSERDRGGIYVISTIGGEPRLIANGGRRPRFSPDGSQICYWVGEWYMGSAFVAPSAGGTPVQVARDFTAALYPVWSQDGKHILFLGGRQSDDVLDWWVAPLAGGTPVKTGAFDILRQAGMVSSWPSLIAPGAWTGDQVFFAAASSNSMNLWRLPISPRTYQADGAPHRLTFGASREDKPSVIESDKDAWQIVFPSVTNHLNIWEVTIDANQGRIAGEPRKLTHAALDAHTSLSADGKRLVFVSNRSGNRDVWLKDLATGKERALTATPVDEEQTDMTADGSRVSYVVQDGRQWDIYALPLGPDGAPGVPEKICGGCGRPWDWSPDGRRLLFLPSPNPRPLLSLDMVDLASGERKPLIHHPKYHIARARFSPDGRWIVVAAGGLRRNRVLAVPADAPAVEDRWVWITDDSAMHDKPRWSPDGNLVYYISDADGFRCIMAQKLDAATKRPLGAAFSVYHSHSARRSLMNTGVRFQEISLSRDRLVFNMEERTGNIWMADLDRR